MMKNLRVAVVPTETGRNSINQRSTVEEILACKQTQLYALTDYFQAQNDDELPMHFSFLIDIKKNADLTGTNIDGIHYDSRAIKIGKIKKIITEWGSTSCCELELDHSPSINSMSGGNIAELIEQFYVDGVESVVYNDDVEINYNNYNYDELSDDILDEVLEIMEDYDTAQVKLHNSCKSENF